jgi:hypothetical protein
MRRRLAGAVRRGVVAFGLLAGLAVASGCTSVANAGNQPTGDQGLIDDLAARLGTAATLSYTAVYVIAGGDTGNIAQAQVPTRTAYVYPTGMTLIADAENVVCTPVKGEMTCTHRASGTAADNAIMHGGMIRLDTVVALLTSASQEADSIVSEDDTTIAGTSATCLTIRTTAAWAPEFHVCVTTDGLLGAFQGTEKNNSVDVTLDHYTMSTASDAFDLPPGAKIIGTAP